MKQTKERTNNLYNSLKFTVTLKTNNNNIIYFLMRSESLNNYWRG